MTTHCRECGSRMCNHGNCPECRPCTHCDGGDRSDKFFGYDVDEARETNDMADAMGGSPWGNDN